MNHHARCVLYLNRFWKRWEAPNADKLALLREAATPGWAPIDENDRLVLKMQYAQDYGAFLVGIGKRCQLCERAGWDVRHHIVPSNYGGINADVNLLALCDPCHDAIHEWLKGKRKQVMLLYRKTFNGYTHGVSTSSSKSITKT